MVKFQYIKNTDYFDCYSKFKLIWSFADFEKFLAKGKGAELSYLLIPIIITLLEKREGERNGGKEKGSGF